MFALLATLTLSTPAPALPAADAAATFEMPALALEPMPAPALLGGDSPFSWTFVEANYVWNDVDAVDDTLDGWEARASLELFFNLFLQAAYSQVTGDADLDQWNIGAGWHFTLGTSLDLFGILSFATQEIDDINFDEDGLMGEVGARYKLGERFELNGEIIWADIDESDTGFDVGARFYLIPALSLGANATFFGEDETYAAGARFEF
jgi:hypothetical protein